VARAPITRANPYWSRKHQRWFDTERSYRNFLARQKGFPSWYAQQRAPRQARNVDVLGSLHPSELESRRRSLEALNSMRREGLPLTEAARQAGTTPAAVLRHAGSALEREGGRYRPKPGDRLLRVMTVLGAGGIEHQVEVRGSRQASLVGAHWSAIGHYLRTGDDSRLREFEGKRVAGIMLEVDPDVIDDWERRGELAIDDIYSLTA
jgi:hypothetical protein